MLCIESIIEKFNSRQLFQVFIHISVEYFLILIREYVAVGIHNTANDHVDHDTILHITEAENLHILIETC